MSVSATSRPHVLVVTGVSKGLGAALVGELLDRGHTVAGCARSGSGLDALRRTHAGSADRLHLSAVDVSDDGQVRQWAEQVIADLGAPSLLINNAALINRSAPLWTLSAAEVAPVFRINIEGITNCLRHFVPAMIAARRGTIVNLSSYWGRSAAAEVAPYCATKFAVEGLSKALAEELPAPLAAVPLNPGIIDTEMLRSCFSDGAAGYEKPAQWAQRAAPFILGLSRKDNGKSLTVPG